MKNTKRIRIIGGDGGHGTAERRTHAISNGGGWAPAHIHARTAGMDRSTDAQSPRSRPRTTAADRQNPTELGTIVAKGVQAKHPGCILKKKGQKNVPLERDKFTQKGGRGRRVNVTEFGPFILSESAALQQSEGASASWLKLVSSDANIHKTSYRFFLKRGGGGGCTEMYERT